MFHTLRMPPPEVQLLHCSWIFLENKQSLKDNWGGQERTAAATTIQVCGHAPNNENYEVGS